MKKYQEILHKLPYDPPFLFVDELLSVDKDRAEGSYTFREDEYFYQGHFKGRPVTPGVILTECMAQIGLVCLGIYLVEGSKSDVESSGHVDAADGKTISKAESLNFVFSESHVLFEKAVFPGEKVRVVSRKKYWRLGKLKCEVEMFNVKNERVCHGTMSGVMR